MAEDAVPRLLHAGVDGVGHLPPVAVDFLAEIRHPKPLGTLKDLPAKLFL